MSDTTTFLDTISDLHVKFDTDRRAARAAAATALDTAGPEDREFLDELVSTFTAHPYPKAMQLLETRYENEPHNRERLAVLTPESDPRLYERDHATRAAVLATHSTAAPATATAQLAAAEMPRQSIRMWRNPPARLFAAPNRATDTSRYAPENIARRVQARAKRRPVVQWEPDVVRTYVAENLYVDTMAREIADAHAADERRAARGLLPRPEQPATPRTLPQVDADQAREMWDHQFVEYVAEQRHHAVALAGTRPVSEQTALAHASERTTLRGDRRPAIPFGGNALDYDHEALHPVTGWRCTSCGIERSIADQHPVHTHHGKRRSDDGLCDMCRTDPTLARLPELPPGFTAADLAHTYCRFLTDTQPNAVHAVLAEVRTRAPQWLIDILDYYLPAPAAPANTDPEPSPQPTAINTHPTHSRGPVPGAGQHRARCDGCTRIRPVSDLDGYCTECRVWLGLITIPTRQRTAA
ncbi:hypothetical protein K7711_46780 [Nocardia sp. CA2R105]|uniref:hypothetical protein n=1 Tax=Nocardia coffeae TaxID=2873381 RepID=UPI001CA76A3E|nr:hypothetical protein [Nocardia coffeae]MBY8864038.1 hypothetical protein [Nocardia coffeae]